MSVLSHSCEGGKGESISTSSPLLGQTNIAVTKLCVSQNKPSPLFNQNQINLILISLKKCASIAPPRTVPKKGCHRSGHNGRQHQRRLGETHKSGNSLTHHPAGFTFTLWRHQRPFDRFSPISQYFAPRAPRTHRSRRSRPAPLIARRYVRKGSKGGPVRTRLGGYIE